MKTRNKTIETNLHFTNPKIGVWYCEIVYPTEAGALSLTAKGKTSGEAKARAESMKAVFEAGLTPSIGGAFPTFEALLDAPGGYRPTLRQCKESPAALVVAELYDATQEARGDPRRAFRG